MKTLTNEEYDEYKEYIVEEMNSEYDKLYGDYYEYVICEAHTGKLFTSTKNDVRINT